MPVNWAFPAAQGEPESFLTILGLDLLLQRILAGWRIFRCSEKILLRFQNRSPARRAVPQFFLHAQ
jgi:hypothetical protein